MSIVIATGCPHSGWEMVLPILQQAGLEPVGDTFARWHDELFQAAGVADSLQLKQPLRPEPDRGESAALLLQASTTPLLLADSRSLWLLDFWAATLPQAKFLLFYTRADLAVAHACLHGREPQEILEGWQAASRQLLQFQRRHRRRVLLLDAEAACRQPQGLVEACERLGLALESRPEWPMSAPLPAVERLLAGHLVAAQPAVQVLQAELEASAQPLGDMESPAELPPVEIFNGYLQRQVYQSKFEEKVVELSKRLQIAEAGQKEEVAQRKQLQAQIDELTKARDAQEQLANEHQAQLVREQQAHQSLAAVQQEAAKEKELLSLQLHQVREELEAAILQKQQLEQGQKEQGGALQQLQGQVEGLTKARDESARAAARRQKELESLTKKQKESAKQAAEAHSQVQKLTEERDAQASLAGERQTRIEQLTKARDEEGAEHQAKLEALAAAQKEAAQENELLLLQLHQVREELEAVFLQKQQLEQGQKEQSGASQQLQGQVEGLTRARDELARVAAERQKELESLTKKQKESAKQAAEVHSQVQKLTKERDAQARLAGERQTLLEQATKARDEEGKLAAERQAKLETLAAAQKEAAQENELLLLQLHQVQEELEAVFLQKQQLEQGQKEQSGASQQLQGQVEGLTRARDELAREAAERRKELESLTEKQKESAKQAADLHSQVQKLAKERDAQAKLALDRQIQIEQLTKARDEEGKLAAERQAKHEALAAGQKEAAQENELLLLQLHQVQEELETIFLQKQNLKQAYDRFETASTKAGQEKDSLVQELQQVRQELARKAREVGEQRQRLAKLKETTSWKITAPVRAVAKSFDKSNKEIKKQVELLKASGLFDAEWYVAEYEDVAFEGRDPIEHYLRYGAAEGRNPSPVFDTKFYLECNPDVAEAGINPLLHFVKFGKKEGRSIRS